METLFTLSPVKSGDIEFMWAVFREAMIEYITLARGGWDECANKGSSRINLTNLLQD